jgi:hypothetical protein
VGAFRSLTAEAAKSIVAGLAVADVGTVTQVGTPVPSAVRALAGDGVVEIPVDAFDVPAVIRMGCHLQGAAGRVQCLSNGVALVTDAYLALPTPAGERPFQIDQVRPPVDLVPVSVQVRFRGDAQTLSLIRAGDVDSGVTRNPLAAGASVLTLGSSGASGTRDVTLQVPAQRGVSGWRYAGGVLRSGAAFGLATSRYEAAGTILRVTPDEPPVVQGGQR